MKKLLYLLFLTLAAGIVSAQQRIADIRPGEPCAGILELEKRLGSLALPDRAESGISRFSGNQGGKDAEIEYHCEEGSLTEQRIRVLFPTREEAYRFAREQRAELSKRLGEPIHDGLDLAGWRKLYFGFMGADLDYLTMVVVWGRAKEDAMLMVRETETKQWQVTLSQGSSKVEYILNS